jgi:C4-dicarboxylate-specific signal transduction histidine kinase
MGVRLFNELELLRDLNKRLELEKAKQALEERDRQRELLLRTAQAELAHVTRVSMMGELTASIAHEILQPLAGATTSANAALRWLAGNSPNLDEARALSRADYPRRQTSRRSDCRDPRAGEKVASDQGAAGSQ